MGKSKQNKKARKGNGNSVINNTERASDNVNSNKSSSSSKDNFKNSSK